jgi:hypothetical protein
MRVVQTAKEWLRLLRLHRIAVVCAFVAGLALFLAAAMIWPKQYRGSALLAINPTQGQRNDPEDQIKAVNAVLRQTTTAPRWIDMVTRLHIYAEMPPTQAARRLSSEVSFEQMTDSKVGGTAVRIGYSGTDRQAVLNVVEAVAEMATRPVSGVPVSRADASTDQTPLYAPVVLPTLPAAPRSAAPQNDRANRHHSARKQQPSPQRRSAAAEAVLAHRFQENLAAGVGLRQAADQNAVTLSQLQAELAKIQASEAAAKAQAAARQRAAQPPPVDPQAERLRQQLAQEQRTLAALEERYTDEYPDVVAARSRVQDTQLDISRLAAITPKPVAPKPAPPPAPTVSAADQQLLESQLSQAEAARDRLQDAIQANFEVTAQLQAEIEAGEHASQPVASTDNLSEATPPPDSYSVTELPSASSPVADPLPAIPPGVRPLTTPGPSPLFLVRRPTVTTRPFFFSYPISLFFGLVFGALASFLAAWVTEQRDPSIRNERMLRRALPSSAVYLGGIPRIRHEVIVD